MLQLKSRDGQIFEASQEVIESSPVLSNMLEKSAFQDKPQIIPIQNVNAAILSKILEFCKIYGEAGNEEGCMDKIKQQSNGIKFIQDNKDIGRELIQAADYLQISSFLDLFKGDTVVLKSQDDVYFVVNREVCNFSPILASRLEDEQPVAVERVVDIQPNFHTFPILNVSAKILRKVIEYCEFHSKASLENISVNEIQMWDQEFVKVDATTLFEIILAANYLNISGILDVTCETVANMIQGMTPEEVKQKFGIENDFTPEEEEEVRRENQWAFE